MILKIIYGWDGLGTHHRLPARAPAQPHFEMNQPWHLGAPCIVTDIKHR